MMASDAQLQQAVADIIKENGRRLAEISETFDPISGQGSIGERVYVRIKDMPASP